MSVGTRLTGIDAALLKFVCMVNIMEKNTVTPVTLPYSWLCLWTERVKEAEMITDGEYTGFLQESEKNFSQITKKFEKSLD